MRTVRILAVFCLLALPLGAQRTTPNIGLQVPARGEQNWDIKLGQWADLLDALLADVPHAGGYVSSIDSQKGAFTFTGAGVSHTGNAYTFSGSGTGIGSIAWTLPSWLVASPSTISASGTETISPATGQTSHQVIGTCGTATTFAPCALVSGDIPNNAANTSGTAANLSGTPALPNGTTGTTQSSADNTTKLATDAFVQAVVVAVGGFTDPDTTLGDMIYQGASTPQRLAGPTAGTVPYDLCSTPSGGVATAPFWCLGGIGGRTVSSSTDTIAATDRGQSVLYATTSAVSIPDPSTLGSNFVFVASARSAAGVIVTFTAAAGAFLNSSGGTATTLTITSGQTCSISSPDNTNLLARCSAARHLAGYTVSTLPSASTLGAGAQVMVTDASTFTVGTCTGGGSNVMIAVSSGSAWSCH